MGLFDDILSGGSAGGGSGQATPPLDITRAAAGSGVPFVDDMTPEEHNTLGLIKKYESRGQNVMNYVGRGQGIDPTKPKGYTAQGYYQLLNSNWNRLAPGLGITTPNAMASDLTEQTRVALALMRESPNGIRNWANFNPALKRALARGEKIGASAESSPVSAPGASGGLFDDIIGKEGTAPVTPVESAPLGPAEGQTDMGGYSPAQVPQAPDMGRGKAAAVSGLSGVTGNFGDEAMGVIAAGGGGAGPLIGGLAGLGRLGYEYLRGQPGEATQTYQNARDAVRQDQALADQQYPGTALASKVGGAVALPGGALLQAATLPARLARSAGVGAAYGGLSGLGEGETTDDRLSRGASGAALGTVGGLAAVPIAAGIGAAARGVARATEPVRNMFRGSGGVEKEASRRVAVAQAADAQAPGGVARMAEWEAARSAGMPVAVADMGGGATRALARSAADTSPVGREAMVKVFDERFEGQFPRLQKWVNEQFHYPNATAQREAIETAARAVNDPAYRRVMGSPQAQSLWDDALEQVSSAPIVQNAIRQATVTSRNEAAKAGVPPMANPFVFDKATGAMTLRTDAAGNRAVPNLAFWDQVKKNLDKMNSGEASSFSRVLREHLDTLVPGYQQARAGAKAFFDADDAVVAGQNFVNLNRNLREAQREFSKLGDGEKKLFQDGFLSRFMEDLGNVRDRRDILKKIHETPNARQKLEMVLGRDKWRELEARLHVETLMNLPRDAVKGGSNTSRFIYNLGLAGGGSVGGYGALVSNDPNTVASGVVLAALSRRGTKVDERIARRVAEMLASPDPQVMSRGIRALASNERLMNAIRSFSAPAGRISGQQGTTSVPALQAGGVGRAEDDGSGAQRAVGGEHSHEGHPGIRMAELARDRRFDLPYERMRESTNVDDLRSSSERYFDDLEFKQRGDSFIKRFDAYHERPLKPYRR